MGGMKIRIRLFAIQREQVGAREVAVELEDPASIEDAWAALQARHPSIGPGRAAVRFARNGEYADPSTRLADGDEVAIIPPVSGGSPDAGDAAVPPAAGDAAVPPEASTDPVRRVLELRAEPFDSRILGELTDHLAVPGDGGVVGFLGRTRTTPGTPAPGQEAGAARHAGGSVESLAYEAHDTMALGILRTIADEIETRFGVRRLAIVHRTGQVPVGVASVAVVACAPHRGAAFEAARYAIDETKARVPIWKAEHFADGHVWIGEPARERASAPDPPDQRAAADDRTT